MKFCNPKKESIQWRYKFDRRALRELISENDLLHSGKPAIRDGKTDELTPYPLLPRPDPNSYKVTKTSFQKTPRPSPAEHAGPKSGVERVQTTDAVPPLGLRTDALQLTSGPVEATAHLHCSALAAGCQIRYIPNYIDVFI